MDTDGEGLADYREDRDGDGLVDSGETDPARPDTDEDGLSDSTEIHVTQTDPVLWDSDNDLIPDLEEPGLDWLVETDPEHPNAFSAVTGWENDVVRQTFRRVVPRGVDAIWLKVTAQTEAWPQDFAAYNDRLTFHVSGPEETGLPRRGAIRLAPHMPPESSVVVQPETWVIYHANTRDTASWIEVEVTAQNLGSSDGHSQITVQVATVAVGQAPLADDRRCYSDTPYGTSGELTHLAEAVVRPGASATITSYLEGKLRFEIDAIGDSLLSWSPWGGVAAHDPATGCFHGTATFTTLPALNSAFGEKEVRLYADGLWGPDSTNTIRAFYRADAFNHPGPTPPAYEGLRPPNYFYYYMQTEAGAPTKTPYGPFWDGGGSRFVPTPPFQYFVEAASQRSGQTIPAPGVNSEQTLTYIDLFAWACRHELKHHTDSVGWFGGASPPFRLIDNPPGTGDDRDAGSWGDLLPDSVEPALPAAGGQYDPTELDSHPLDDYEWSPLDPRPDSQRHTCITAQEWTQTGSSAAWDWAAPGKNYPAFHP